MADFPFRGDGCFGTDYGVLTATTTLTQLTAPTINNVKGAWQEIIPSVLNLTRGFVVQLSPAITLRLFLVDIGVGPSGSEQVIVNNIAVPASTSAPSKNLYFPIGLPQGVRVAMRYQTSNVTDVSLLGSITTFSTGFYVSSPWSRVVTLGANTADSSGVTITSPNGSKSSYVQLIGSLPFDIYGLVISISNSGDFSLSGEFHLIDIATGASGSEYDVIKNLPIQEEANTDIFYPNVFGPIPFHAIAGSRISARAQANGAGNPFDIVLYGFA